MLAPGSRAPQSLSCERVTQSVAMLANAAVRCPAPCPRPQRPFTARLSAVKVGRIALASTCRAAVSRQAGELYSISLSSQTGARVARRAVQLSAPILPRAACAAAHVNLNRWPSAVQPPPSPPHPHPTPSRTISRPADDGRRHHGAASGAGRQQRRRAQQGRGLHWPREGGLRGPPDRRQGPHHHRRPFQVPQP